MKQLTGLDASFLYMETPTTFGHVNGIGIYQRPTPDFDPYEHVYAKFGSMVGKVEPMRRRLAEVPLRLDHPYWFDDPEFDLDFHIRQIGLAPPGGADQLAEQVARIVGRPMDRTRPLWEVYVIEGLADGRWALLTKYHHATIDGASGMILLNMLTDPDPNAPPPEPGEPWTGEPMPTDMALLSRTLRNLAANPAKSIRLQLRIAKSIADAAGVTSVSGAIKQARALVKTVANQGGEDKSTSRVRLPMTSAPPTPWNKTITPHRRFAMRGTSLENIKRLKEATGGTVNDVVMAICAGALREYLLRHDALPDGPLRAMVPVSIRTGNETDPWTNRVSGIVADLPTNCADPLERVARCREAMSVAKKQFELVPAEALVDLAQFASPVVAASAMRLASRLKLADRITMPANIVISNVPGPRQALYFAGAKMDNYIPVSIVTDGMGLNITVHSYLDRLDFGLISDRELVPDLWDLADLCIAEIERLFEATGAEWAVPQAAPAARRATLLARRRASSNGNVPRQAVAKAVVKKAVVKKAVVKKAVVKKAVVKKAVVKKAVVKKTVVKKATAKKTTARRG
jgi:diacylglycerol O-acyltransferase / wax synthase